MTCTIDAMSLFSRKDELPGVHGVMRDCTSDNAKGFKRLSQGDIAIIDAPDITRQFAQELIESNPAVVVNLAEFSTGAVPNFGPRLLLDSGIDLVEGAGAEVLSQLRDGKKGRVTEEGELFHGDKHIGSGRPVSADDVDETFAHAQRSLVDHMEAYFGNTIEFINSEAPLLVDGLGIPDTGETLRGRKALVVSPGPGHKEQLADLRNFIREYDPVVVGVDAGADTVVSMGYKPDFIVGNPDGIDAATLRCGARVILPADPDGHAAGLERIQDLGIGAMTFPAATSSATDLALLLVNFHEADLIVLAGAPLDLDAMFARRSDATPSALVTRAKVGPRLVDASAVSSLYTVPSGGGIAWLWAVLGLLVALAVMVVIAGLNGDGSFVDNMIDTWNNIALTVQGWFK